MLRPQMMTMLAADFLGDALQPRGAHLARRSDRKAIAGDEERLPGVHPRAEVRHQVAERPGLPSLVERLEALGDAVGRRRDLIGVNRVELLRARRRLGIPEHQRAAAR